jgi:WD40 repeat protein
MTKLAAATLLFLAVVFGGPAVSNACVGDCGNDGSVTVDEILVGVNIALGTASFDQCTAFDGNTDQQVTVDEILTGVNNALSGCVTLAGAYSGQVAFDSTHTGIMNITAATGGQVSGSLVITAGGSGSASRFQPNLSFSFPAGNVSVDLSGIYDPNAGGFEVSGSFVDVDGQPVSVDISGTLPGPAGTAAVKVYIGGDVLTMTLSAGSLPVPSPTPQPGGEPRIVYAGGVLDIGIFVINSDGSGKTKVHTPSVGLVANPAWSPDGTKIAFASPDDQNHHVGIAVMNADGSNFHLLQDPADFFLDGDPAWSPDGSRIAFTAGGGDAIDVINADGSGRHRLVTETVGERYGHMSWSPDGSRIAFQSTRPRQAGSQDRVEIWVMNADGSNLVRLTNNDLPDRHPDWSPDGQRIIFERANSFAGGIMSIKPDGSGETRLIFDAFGTSAPSWSADGQSLAYASLLSIAITDASGGHAKSVPDTMFITDFDFR